MENKTIYTVVSVRVSVTVYEQIQKLAQERGEKMASTLRYLLSSALEKEKNQ